MLHVACKRLKIAIKECNYECTGSPPHLLSTQYRKEQFPYSTTRIRLLELKRLLSTIYNLLFLFIIFVVRPAGVVHILIA